MSVQDIEGRRGEAIADDGSSYNKIVDWLNEASLASETTTKTEILSKVQEIIVKKEPGLLDSFLDEVIAFQNDRNSDVRRLVVGIIEEAVKKDANVLPRVAPSLLMLLQDGSAQVQKRVVQAAAQVYRAALAWLSHANSSHEVVEATWNAITAIKAQIVHLVDCENDGIRTHAVKFLENVVLMQTYPEPDGMVRRDDFSLEDVPMTLKIARRRKLEEEALMVFELLLNFHGSPHISSVNLMTCMGSLTLIAKMRPQLFMGKVITAFENLHSNLPPTLSKSQVSSVSKHLKIQLLNLLKQPSSIDFHSNITSLLSDLGASHQEVMRSFPHPEELRRRQKRVAQMAPEAPQPSSKKPRIEVEEEIEAEASEEDETMQIVNTVPTVEVVPTAPAPIVLTDEAINIAEKYVLERLTPDVATELVIQNMMKLPDTVPPSFCAEYKPIPNAGSPLQIKILCRLLAEQLCAAGMDPTDGQIKQPKAEVDSLPEKETKPSLTSVMTEIMDKEKETQQPTTSQLSGTVTVKVPKQRVRTLKLSEITKPLSTETRGNMMRAAVKRILNAEHAAAVGGVTHVRSKMIATIAVTFSTEVRDVVLDFLLDDIRGRIDLAFTWLYEEYSFMQGFSRLLPFIKREEAPEDRYNKLLCSLVKSLGDRPGQESKDSSLLSRLFLEAPLVSDEAVDILRRICGDRNRAAAGIYLLQELVVRRPPRKITFLNALLMHTAHEDQEVRIRALDAVTQLYDRGELRSIIEEYAMLYLSFLRLPNPPDVLFGPDRGRLKSTIPAIIECRSTSGEAAPTPWNEETVRACLYLYLALLPLNEEMIHELARVYVQTAADMKRTILRLLEQPVRGMGMDSPQLLRLVEECPKGAETLVTRVIHILTEKTPPSAELVARVRELYHTRVSDVRFLIPVLNGLSKNEVIAALPKLIKLNPVVVKEVFNRLLGTHTESPSHTSPLTPAELLIALHNIDPSKCELKTVIKATSLCFSEKQAYSQEVLAVVLQHLMEMTPLPTLLMRTVIQSLSLYPRLIGFVMNILQRLILKQVWKQKKVWEGFIKCCQRTKPQSFQVLLQLPPAQLSDVFQVSPDLREPLLAHVTAFTDNQRAHIPKSIMDVLLGSKRTSNDEYDIDTEARSPSELTIDIKEEPEDYNSRSEPAPPGLD